MFSWSLFCRIGLVTCGLWCFYPASSKVLPLLSFILLACLEWSLFSDELFLLLGSLCSWFLLNCFLTTLAFLHMASYVCEAIASGGCQFSPWLWHMWDFSFQWLLDEFPASLVCQCTLVLPGAFPSKVLCFFFGYSPAVLSLVMPVLLLFPMCPPAPCGHLYFCTSFLMDVLLWAAVTLVLGFFVCNRILGPFDHVFGSLWLSELCSFFPAALLTVPTLEVSYGWHRGLHCRFWSPLCLAGCVTWICLFSLVCSILWVVLLEPLNSDLPGLVPCSVVAGFLALLWILFEFLLPSLP